MPRHKEVRLSDIGEFGLIDLLARQVPCRKNVKCGIGDDAAVIEYKKDKYLLVTTDMLLEDVHFTRRTLPRDIGYKALACNISDIAAMGGVPLYAVISLGVPKNLKLDFVRGIYNGFKKLSKKFDFSIVGGDTIRSKNIVINVALLGQVKKTELVLRSGAKKGDMIFVGGKLGNSLKSGRHASFMPRIDQAQYLVRNFKPSSMIDISDGLISDLNHILKASNAGAVLYKEYIPRQLGASLANALYDGEDFELLFTLPKKRAQKLLKEKKKNFCYIGDITSEKGKLILVDLKGKRVETKTKGFTHF